LQQARCPIRIGGIRFGLTPADVVTLSGLRNEMKAVDLCCGDGWFTVPIAQKATFVAGIDLDPALIAQADKRLAAAKVKNYSLEIADARDIKHLASDQDFVFIANTFHGVDNKTDLARGVRAVLCLGGLFAVINWHPLPREQTCLLGKPRGPHTELRMSPQQTAELIEPAGFRLRTLWNVSDYHYVATFEASC
jgi:ubiquinone/menaquinone biosynthesis C-methylase UbiE